MKKEFEKEENQIAETIVTESIETISEEMDTEQIEATDELPATEETNKKSKRKKKAAKEKKVNEKGAKKKMSKRAKRRIVIGVIAAILVLFIVVKNVVGKSAGIPVFTTTTIRADIEQTLSTSGTVESEESKTYFAPVALKIGSIPVAKGDNVKKGDVLLAYDETALLEAKELADLKLQSNEGGYESSLIQNNKYIAELGEANINLDVLEQQIADCEAHIKEVNQKIEEKKAALSYEGALLQISLIDWADHPDSEEYENLQKLVQLNSYEQSNNKEIRAWQKEVQEHQDMVSAYKEYKAKMESQQSSSEGGKLNSGSMSKLEADTEMEKINSNKTLEAIGQVENGLLADFAGVVTSVDVVEGATPLEGAQLMTIQSIEKVKVVISVSKYDLEKIAVGQEAEIDIAGNTYTGKVTKIDGMATTNASGTAVVGAEIEIQNPDDKIFLGVEAKVVIKTASASQAVAVPMEVINADKEGDFVYVVTEGTIAKKRVEIGISSDEYCEVLQGLAEGEEVVTTSDFELSEGMAVTAIPKQ